jgi:hypothetical protein
LGRSEAASKEIGIRKFLIFKYSSLGRSESASKEIGIRKFLILSIFDLLELNKII